MTSVATGIGVCCAVSLTVAAARVPQTPPPPNPKPPLQTSAKPAEAEITVTGCLVQGSTASVFVLRDAKRDPQSAAEKAARYVVVPATEDLFLTKHVNHQVRILGVPDGRPQPTPQAGNPVDEKLIPALNAKSLTMVSPSCVGGSGGDWGTADGLSAGGGASGSGAASLASTVGRAAGRFATGGYAGTLLLIASGLLLVVYAGRRDEWTAFGRRSPR